MEKVNSRLLFLRKNNESGKIFGFSISNMKVNQAIAGQKTQGFTLIEILVSITILAILMMIAYVPYAHYQKKAKLRLASREISQSFYEAKNMAVSGIKYLRTSDTGEYESQNKSIGLYITTEEGKNDRIIFFSYPYDTLIEDISVSGDTSIIKTNIIQGGVKINTLSGDDSNYGNLLFFYNAIIGDLKVYNFDASLSKDEVEDDKIFIDFSYMNATNSSLNKRLTYFRQTSIIDYD